MAKLRPRAAACICTWIMTVRITVQMRPTTSQLAQPLANLRQIMCGTTDYSDQHAGRMHHRGATGPARASKRSPTRAPFVTLPQVPMPPPPRLFPRQTYRRAETHEIACMLTERRTQWISALAQHPPKCQLHQICRRLSLGTNASCCTSPTDEDRFQQTSSRRVRRCGMNHPVLKHGGKNDFIHPATITWHRPRQACVLCLDVDAFYQSHITVGNTPLARGAEPTQLLSTPDNPVTRDTGCSQSVGPGLVSLPKH